MTGDAVGAEAGMVHGRTREARKIASRVTAFAGCAANRNVIRGLSHHGWRADKCQARCMTGRTGSGTDCSMIHRRARERGEITAGMTALAGRGIDRHMIGGQNFQLRRHHVRKC